MPLYHQIVQAIRWRIGTGELAPGGPLPGVREAAELWGVNYHTVRRAYQELAGAGWVNSQRGSGTHVAEVRPAGDPERADDLRAWIGSVAAVAAERYGLPPAALAELLLERQSVLRVVMVECNRHQSALLARQLERALSVEAIPWSLEERGEPPHLPLIGTYFHHGEMRNRWPGRVADMHFVTLRTDAALAERVRPVAERRGASVLWLAERDIGTAHEMAAGVAALFAPDLEVRPVVADPAELLAGLGEDELLLVAPRLWDDLPPEVRADERVFDVVPRIASEDIEMLGRALESARVAAGRA
jgi:DNA-binding transcriptional regulator YhcF (GntR family)